MEGNTEHGWCNGVNTIIGRERRLLRMSIEGDRNEGESVGKIVDLPAC
jgi:hypothetical protein